MKQSNLTEKDKMLKGMPYNANYDETLIKEITLAKDKCYKYNTSKPSNLNERNKVIKSIL